MVSWRYFICKTYASNVAEGRGMNQTMKCPPPPAFPYISIIFVLLFKHHICICISYGLSISQCVDWERLDIRFTNVYSLNYVFINYTGSNAHVLTPNVLG